MINARPNLNGNTAADFVAAATELSEALDTVDKALANIRSNVFHGRNYRTIPSWQQKNTARGGDDRRIEYATKHVPKLRYLGKQIAARVLREQEA